MHLLRSPPSCREIEENKSNITLCGETGKTAETVLTYDDNSRDGVGTSDNYSLRVRADDVSAENITFENSTGSGTQAVALMIRDSDRVQFRNCRMIGYQDTVFVHSGTQYFRDCYIQGSVDYIFGGSTAVFDNCTMYTIEGGTAVTAPSTDASIPFGIVFLGGEATANSSVSSGSQHLGRSWGDYGATAYIRTVLDAHISGIGWGTMGDNDLADARFSEYQTTGPGANPSARASESKQLSDSEAAAYTVDNIFGSWTPSFSL